MRVLKILGILVFLALISSASYADVYQSKTFTGNIGLVSGGDGLTDWILQSDGSFLRPNYSSGTINSVNIGGTAIWANMYWQSFVSEGLPQTGDPDVTLNGNAVHGTLLSKMPGEDGIGYYADVTKLMQSGIHNYTINGVNFGTPPPGSELDVHQNGWGLDVVYSNPGLQYAQIQTQYSNDYAYWRTNCPGGGNCSLIQHSQNPNSAVDQTQYARQTRAVTFTFDPVQEKRVGYITVHVAGAEPNGIRYSDADTDGDGVPGFKKYDPNFPENRNIGLMRPTAKERTIRVWLAGGSGTANSWLIDKPWATVLANEKLFGSQDGSEWDTYTFAIDINAGENFKQIQLESDDNNWYGESFALISTSFYLPLNCPPPPPPVIPEPTTMSLWGLGAALAALRKKFMHKA